MNCHIQQPQDATLALAQESQRSGWEPFSTTKLFESTRAICCRTDSKTSGNQSGSGYDEMFDSAGAPRAGVDVVNDALALLRGQEMRARHRAGEKALWEMDEVYNQYGADSESHETPAFDLIPRLINPREWQRVEAAVAQRARVLNLFIDDVYHGQRILKDRVIPPELIYSAKGYSRECSGWRPAHGIWCHAAAFDLVRASDGAMLVQEDILQGSPGITNVLENRRAMKNLFPSLFSQLRIRPVADYPARLRKVLEELAPRANRQPRLVLLSSGPNRAGYFGHSYLAQQMGVELVEGGDLVVKDGRVFMRTTEGFERVDVIYRGTDGEGLLTMPEIRRAGCAGTVALANLPGAGIAEDRAIYAYVPTMIRYYLGEDSLLPNVSTWVCADKTDLQYVLGHLPELVIKPVNGSDGEILAGRESTRHAQAAMVERIKANPRNYVAQTAPAWSRMPTLAGEGIESRVASLRVYAIQWAEVFVLPGGLTRVASQSAALLRRSLEGCQCKDTCVLAEARSGDGPKDGLADGKARAC